MNLITRPPPVEWSVTAARPTFSAAIAGACSVPLLTVLSTTTPAGVLAIAYRALCAGFGKMMRGIPLMFKMMTRPDSARSGVAAGSPNFAGACFAGTELVVEPPDAPATEPAPSVTTANVTARTKTLDLLVIEHYQRRRA